MRRNIFLASALLCTLFISISLSYEINPETNNLILSTIKDFDYVLKENQYFLVNFHALWCKYSKQLRPEWTKVSKALIDENVHVKLAEVEAYDNKELAQKYKVEGTPTTKFFVNQQAYDYTGLNNASNILEFVNRKLKKPLSEVFYPAAVQSALNEYEWVGILVGGAAANEDIIKDVAFDNSDIWFVKTGADQVKMKYGQARDGVFILVNNYTGGFDTFTGSLSRETIAQFIKEKKFPNVPRFHKAIAEKIFYGDEPAMILIKSTANGDKAEETAFQTASKAIGKDILMTIAAYDEEIGRLLCRNLGIEQSELPTVRIVKPGNDRILKYYFDGKIIIDSVQQFYQDYKNQKAKRFYLSEPVPRENDDLVRKVVGKTFNDVVNDPNLDVLLFITVPWCSHCVALNPIYDNVARKTNKVANFLVAKIDASENDLEAFGLDVLDFPTILFFPRNNKANPIDMQGQKDEYAFDTFIRAHANVSLSEMKGPNPFDKDEL